MKQNEDRPLTAKKNAPMAEDDELSSSIIQEHLQDKNHIITDEDIRNIPVESSQIVENEENSAQSEENKLASITEADPDEENKMGLDSPWNIYS